MNFDLSSKNSDRYFKNNFIKAYPIKIKSQSDQWLLTSEPVLKKRWWIGKLWDWITKPQGRISRVRDAMIGVAQNISIGSENVLTPDLGKLKIEDLKGRLKKFENVYDNLKGFNDQVIFRHNNTWTSRIFFWSRVDQVSTKSPQIISRLQTQIMRLSQETAKKIPSGGFLKEMSRGDLESNLLLIQDLITSSTYLEPLNALELSRTLKPNQVEIEKLVSEYVKKDIAQLNQRVKSNIWSDEDKEKAKHLDMFSQAYQRGSFNVESKELKEAFKEQALFEKFIEDQSKSLKNACTKLEGFLSTYLYNLGSIFNVQKLSHIADPETLIDTALLTRSYLPIEDKNKASELFEKAKAVRAYLENSRALLLKLSLGNEKISQEEVKQVADEGKALGVRVEQEKVAGDKLSVNRIVLANIRSFAGMVGDIAKDVNASIQWLEKAKPDSKVNSLETLKQNLVLGQNLLTALKHYKVFTCETMKDIENLTTELKIEIDRREIQIGNIKRLYNDYSFNFTNWLAKPQIIESIPASLDKNVIQDFINTIPENAKERIDLEKIRDSFDRMVTAWNDGLEKVKSLENLLKTCSNPYVKFQDFANSYNDWKKIYESNKQTQPTLLSAILDNYFNSPSQKTTQNILEVFSQVLNRLQQAQFDQKKNNFSWVEFLEMIHLIRSVRDLRITEGQFKLFYTKLLIDLQKYEFFIINNFNKCSEIENVDNLPLHYRKYLIDLVNNPSTPKIFADKLSSISSLTISDSLLKFIEKCGQYWNEGSVSFTKDELALLKVASTGCLGSFDTLEYINPFKVLKIMVENNFHPNFLCGISFDKIGTLIMAKKPVNYTVSLGKEIEGRKQYYDGNMIMAWYEKNKRPLNNDIRNIVWTEPVTGQILSQPPQSIMNIKETMDFSKIPSGMEHAPYSLIDATREFNTLEMYSSPKFSLVNFPYYTNEFVQLLENTLIGRSTHTGKVELTSPTKENKK